VFVDEPITWNRPAVSRKESSGGTGVKRTKSLMQRIRNMVRRLSLTFMSFRFRCASHARLDLPILGKHRC
jgi:hypothetical protein